SSASTALPRRLLSLSRRTPAGTTSGHSHTRARGLRMRLVQSSPERPHSARVTHGIGTSLKQVAVRGGDSAKIRIAALLSRPYWSETEVLAQERNLSDLALMSRDRTRGYL